jgi:hypothetical protein
MNEDLQQLLENLKLKTIAARFEEMLAAAEANSTPVPTLFTQLLRAEWHARQEQVLESRIKPLKGGMDTGILPLQGAKGRQGTPDPYAGTAGVYPQGREHRVHRRDRCWKNRLDGLTRSQSRAERLSGAVHRGAGPVR